MLQPARFRIICILLLLSATAVFSFMQMRSGQGWGDDFALYIHHAKNIAEGKSYTETGYIFNDLAFTYSPQNYPPGMPVLLSPIYAIWGMNFTAMHILMIILFVWLLWLIFLLLKDQLNFWYLFLLLAIIAFSPGFWGVTDDIVSDLPAACFVLLFFYVIQKRGRIRPVWFILIAGIVASISFSFRATGCLLLPVALFVKFIQTRKIDKQLVYAFLLFLFFVVMESILIRNEKGYLYMLQLAYQDKGNLADYFSGMANSYLQAFKDLTYFGGGSNTNLNQLFGSFLFVLFICGFYLKCRKSFSEWELFFILYILVLILFPAFQGFRFLLPLLPFYLFYIFNTLQSIHQRVATIFIFLFSMATIIVYVHFYRTIPAQWAQYRMDQPETWEAMDFMKLNLPADAIVMATKPRVVSLYTDKQATVYPDGKYEDVYYQNQDSLHVNYIFTSWIDKYQYPKLKAEADTVRFKKIFSNQKFAVFEVKR